MPTSPDHLLRIIRRLPDLDVPTPHVLGVDDWALRRGQGYGTILCDLERHRPVDLFPERSAKGLHDWLVAHAGVQVISRDRGDAYAKGARTGAPGAVQVVDRWHLLHNLHEAVMREAEHCGQQIRDAAKWATAEYQQRYKHASSPKPHPSTQGEQRKQANRDRRRRRYREVVVLHQQGLSLRAIARDMAMSRRTVRRFIQADGYPERADRDFCNQLSPFSAYLYQRWNEGCCRATTLFKELQQKGFTGSYSAVSRYVARWRGQTPHDDALVLTTFGQQMKIKCPSPRGTTWLLTCKRTCLKPPQQVLRQTLRARCPQLKRAAALARWFARLMRMRQAHKLKGWIAQACAPHAPPSLRRFARGLLKDLPPIQAAMTLPWSNGQVEGQINRLKLIKRQMYGRANFDLLRARYLYAN